MIKVLLFSYHLMGKGGTETVIDKWFTHLNKDYDLELLIYGDGPQPDQAFLQGKKASMLKHEKGVNRVKALYYLWKKISLNNYDYIICFGFNHLRAIHMALKFMKGKKPKVFYWTHFRVEEHQFNKKHKDLLEASDGVLALCDQMAEQFSRFNLSPNKIHTIYNPVERANLMPKTKDNNSFCYIGRLDENQKRVSDIIKAFYLLVKRENKNYKLKIIGVGDSYDFYNYLIKRYKLQQHIDFVDLWFTNPWDFIDEMDCLILSSNFEGFGMVIAEALSRGIPVISSNCPVGPSDLIIDGKTGYLYEIGNLLELKDKIDCIATKKLSTSQKDISNSIEKMYTENYFLRIKSILS